MALPRAVHCLAKAKGFGGEKAARAKDAKDGSTTATDGSDKLLVKDAKNAARARTSKARPVSPEEAARGKLDYVQVADWGTGDYSALGNLRMVQYQPQYRGTEVQEKEGSLAAVDLSVGDSAEAHDGAGVITRSPTAGQGQFSSAATSPIPFYNQLAQQLQMAESRGGLAVSGPPPPPLAEWSFKEERYLQYLMDLQAVHQALEGALLQASSTETAPSHGAAVAEAGRPGAESPSPSTSGNAHEGRHAAAAQGAQHALQHLAPTSAGWGLERAAAIGSDLSALQQIHQACSSNAGDAAGQGRSSVHPAKRQQQAGNSHAGAMAKSYADLLKRTARACTLGETEQEREMARLRLLAHASVLHIVHQASGMRFGAAATEKLGLLQRRAASLYMSYPDQVADPQLQLRRALDAAGRHLESAVARQVVFDELPSAMQKASLLMTALAHRN